MKIETLVLTYAGGRLSLYINGELVLPEDVQKVDLRITLPDRVDVLQLAPASANDNVHVPPARQVADDGPMDAHEYDASHGH